MDGGIELSKEQDICVFSLVAEPMGVIWKEVGTMSPAEFVLMSLNALGDHNGPGRADCFGFLVEKKTF